MLTHHWAPRQVWPQRGKKGILSKTGLDCSPSAESWHPNLPPQDQVERSCLSCWANDGLFLPSKLGEGSLIRGEGAEPRTQQSPKLPKHLH